MSPTVWSTISETLREAGKQRLLNALKLADHTVGNIEVSRPFPLEFA